MEFIFRMNIDLMSSRRVPRESGREQDLRARNIKNPPVKYKRINFKMPKIHVKLGWWLGLHPILLLGGMCNNALDSSIQLILILRKT